MFDAFGNKVRIKSTPETENKGLAGKEGEVFGQTTPSMMDVEVIGSLTEDIAINVHFEDLNESFWFAEDLIENLDNGQGTEITIDGVGKKWTKGENGEWIEENVKQDSKWWQFWK
ncbi:hypothetical protein DFQ05_2659 [Winogradskyella wandonensis]|uniref:Uncharacterized protein n=1 Tax=Winogradskyella wandonensis TaxID=1442586 RepID=A0A4R1KIJ4_9FLAO|nr:hypothetical protein [Winogradskyella wandonensis]TCK64676.1 hypothetical protein DFQ05_2659 [Winogradskyella wandonensis]